MKIINTIDDFSAGLLFSLYTAATFGSPGGKLRKPCGVDATASQTEPLLLCELDLIKLSGS